MSANMHVISIENYSKNTHFYEISAIESSHIDEVRRYVDRCVALARVIDTAVFVNRFQGHPDTTDAEAQGQEIKA